MKARTFHALIAACAACLAIVGSPPTVSASNEASYDETSSPESQSCAAPDGWDTVEAAGPRFVIFGETHGTTQAPKLVSDVVCDLAMRGKRVLLAIELSSGHNPDLQEAWNAPEAKFHQALEQGGWERREDGVGSVAMVDMVERAHRRKSRGASIDIVAFNGARDAAQRRRFAHLPGQGPHEAAQAENIADAAQRADYDIVIVLVGNLHAEKAAITMGGVTFEPMAMQLSHYGSVISLHYASTGGKSWACIASDDFDFVPGEPIADDAIVCGPSSSSGRSDLGRDSFVALGAFPGSEENGAFDGYFWLGPITASPPAFPE